MIMSQLAAPAEFRLYMTATPGENPSQMAYLGDAGMFDEMPAVSAADVEPDKDMIFPAGTPATLFAFGAEPSAVMSADPPESENDPLPAIMGWLYKWLDRAHTGDALDPSILATQMNSFIQNTGLYSFHPLVLNPGMAVLNFKALPAGVLERNPEMKRLHDLYTDIEDAYKMAWVNTPGELGKSGNKMHLANLQKRLLEAIKAYWAVERAREILSKDGPHGGENQIALFFDYKSTRHVGSYTRGKRWIAHKVGKAQLGDRDLIAEGWLDPAYVKTQEEMIFEGKAVLRLQRQWEQEIEALRQSTGNPKVIGPPAPFAVFIYQIAVEMDQKGIDEVIPSGMDILKTEAMPKEARAQLNKDLGWKIDATRDGDFKPEWFAERHGGYVSALPDQYALVPPGSQKKSVNQMEGELEQWKTGKLRILLASSDAAGTGLSLHDDVGDKPYRYQIIVSLPWRPTLATQVSGRLARAGLMKEAEVEFLLMPEIPFETQRAQALGRRFLEMDAMVTGEVSAIGASLTRDAARAMLFQPAHGAINLSLTRQGKVAYEPREVAFRDERLAEDLAFRLRHGRSPLTKGKFTTGERETKATPAKSVKRSKSKASVTGETLYIVSWEGLGALNYTNDPPPYMEMPEAKEGEGAEERMGVFGWDLEAGADIDAAAEREKYARKTYQARREVAAAQAEVKAQELLLSPLEHEEAIRGQGIKLIDRQKEQIAGAREALAAERLTQTEEAAVTLMGLSTAERMKFFKPFKPQIRQMILDLLDEAAKSIAKPGGGRAKPLIVDATLGTKNPVAQVRSELKKKKLAVKSAGKKAWTAAARRLGLGAGTDLIKNIIKQIEQLESFKEREKGFPAKIKTAKTKLGAAKKQATAQKKVVASAQQVADQLKQQMAKRFDANKMEVDYEEGGPLDPKNPCDE